MNEHAILPHVIVTDDDEDLREMVSDYLAGQGFSVCGVASGAALDAALSERPADLLIIDLNLPSEDGFSIARRIRAGSTVPIIMLTGAAAVVDRIVGLEMGADDYVTKPFDLRELKARIRAVLRRGATQPADPVTPSVVR